MSEAYSRLYHRFAQEFPDVYADDHLLASWTRLLVVADASWPLRPPVPRAIPARVLRTLVERALVILDGGAYTVRGLDAERTRRRDAGRTGAAKRWQSDRNANASAVAMPRRDEYETSTSTLAREGLTSITPDVALAWSNASGRGILGSGAFAQSTVDDLATRHGPAAVIAAIIASRRDFSTVPGTAPLAVAVRNRLDPLPDARKAAVEDREEANLEAGRRRVLATIRAGHASGGHTTPHPRCPDCHTGGKAA